MSVIRPDLSPAGLGVRAPQDARAAAFFRAALGQPGPAVAAEAPRATLDPASLPRPLADRVEALQDGRLARPGALLDIRV